MGIQWIYDCLKILSTIDPCIYFKWTLFQTTLTQILVIILCHKYLLIYRGETVRESDVCEHGRMLHPILNNIPVFKLADLNFLCQVSLAMSTYVFAPGDIVLYNGDTRSWGRCTACTEMGCSVEVRIYRMSLCKKWYTKMYGTCI